MVDVTFVCPFCGGKVRGRDATKERIYQEIIKLAAQFGGTWHLVDEYIDCFRVSEKSTMDIKKQLRLLKEIYEILIEREFEYKGKRYRTTREEIIKAMLAVCNGQIVGLTNQNYLKAIVVKNSQRVSAEGMTAAEEKEREQVSRGAGEQEATFLEQAPEDVADHLRNILNTLGDKT